MSMPLVSAIMPVYNAEEFLETAIASALAQDYESFEVVACDDGSTDRSLEIVTSHPEVHVLSQENRGPAAARNAAIAACRGEFVAMFDADDEWPEDRVTLQASYLVERPDAGCVLGRQEWINPPPWLRRDAVNGGLDAIPLVSAMYRRAAVETVGLFDTTFTPEQLQPQIDRPARMKDRRPTLDAPAADEAARTDTDQRVRASHGTGRDTIRLGLSRTILSA